MNDQIFKAFLSGVDPSMQHSELTKFLKTLFQGILYVKTDSKKKQGYVFVHLKTQKDLECFLAEKSLNFKGRTLTVKPYFKGSELTKFKDDLRQKRLFVKRIPSSWKDEDLLQYFEQFGEIDSAYIVFDKTTKKSR